MRRNCHILLILWLLAACAEEQTLHENATQRLHISFAEEGTRSIWNDMTDTDANKVSYMWENNNNMLTAIKHGGQYVPFYETLDAAAQYHTPTQFETVDAEKSKIKLQTTRGVKYEVAGAAYVYPVAAGDQMYCLHPISSYTTTSSSAAAVHADMSLPTTFSYTQQQNDLSSLADYSYVYTATTLKSVNDNAVVAHASHFNSACAIIR
ncbi:MAG: hypothetical protein PUF39_10540, partial [Prevotellaceae bacterium]|nr:hypothetical protein [Prevotellaceae bacterium]